MPRRRYPSDPPTEPVPVVRADPAMAAVSGWAPTVRPVIYDLLCGELQFDPLGEPDPPTEPARPVPRRREEPT